ncbi:hypothetical protein EKO04_008634 [Ascochyta lentis]|uniref:Uncharacterized protein n=1 Tax=Ascochyta lentis TaxID=205686 RepID=A0A8H7IXU0_9PLEO|nr:hypothetical protein EKO04_008634 [Ascochyta lentis]
MVCREEHVMDTNSAGLTAVLRNLRLERIAQVWQNQREIKHNIWVNEYNRRIEEMDAQEEADEAFIERYGAWWEECREVMHQLQALAERFNANDPVTPADWDVLTAGKERKVFAILSPRYPKETWPRSVPYLNLIAYALHKEEENDRQEQCMEQYLRVMEDVKRRGEEALGIKRIVGDSSDGIGFQTPLTETEVQEYRDMVRIEQQQLHADEARFFTELDDLIRSYLHGQPVYNENWDVGVWAESLLEEADIVATDEVKEHIIQSVYYLTQQSQKREGVIDEFKDAAETDSEQNVDREGDLFLPYDV